MKKVVVFFMLLIVSFAYSQESEGHYGESTSSTNNVEIGQVESAFYNSDANVGIGTEMVLSQNIKFMNLPINFRIRKLGNFTFQSYIPIIFKKEVGNEKAGGLGDISIGGSYWMNVFNDYLFKSSISVSLPTGDDEKTVNGTPIALGSGSFGFVANTGLNGYIGDGKLSTDLNYIINTPNTTTSENSVTHAITETKRRAGNSISFNGSYKHPLPIQNLYISGATQFNLNGKGHFERVIKDSNGVEFFSTEGDYDNIFSWKLSTEVEYQFAQFGMLYGIINSVYFKVRYPVLYNVTYIDKEVTFALGVKKNF
ncbi:MAG: hypothetical protein U9N76_08390 [Candidatus Marinimicrobia bacterium]|nr:hypothetical protein [Candidatus Neomarinimicrobiota bacterium]